MPKDRPTQRQMTIMSSVYNEAMTNALINGMGLIKIVYTGRDLEFSAVSSEEYRDMAEALIWADKYRTKQKIQ